MEEDQGSRTAWITAYYRALHHQRDQPLIFDDPLAQDLLPPGSQDRIAGRLLAAYRRMDPAGLAACQDQASALARAMRGLMVPAHVLSRACHAERALDLAMAEGVRQYVILGAGLDSFALRRPELMERLEVFEVDHPASQAYKRSRLAELGWTLPERLHFVAVDFTRQSLAERLAASPFDPSQKSFFAWMGVTYYLPRQAVLDTFAAVAGLTPAGGSLVFDYRDARAGRDPGAGRRERMVEESLQKAGEPLVSDLDPEALAGDLAERGLRLREDLGAAQIERRYFAGRDDGYHASPRVRYAWAVRD